MIGLKTWNLVLSIIINNGLWTFLVLSHVFCTDFCNIPYDFFHNLVECSSFFHHITQECQNCQNPREQLEYRLKFEFLQEWY